MKKEMKKNEALLQAEKKEEQNETEELLVQNLKDFEENYHCEEWEWESEPEVDLKFSEQFPTQIMDDGCIGFFFQEPTFPSVP